MPTVRVGPCGERLQVQERRGFVCRTQIARVSRMLHFSTKGGSPRFAFCCVALFLLLAWPVRAAVLSVGLGSEWMKVAVVNIKPGQNPISIAINEMSKRKTSSLVALSNGDRFVGEAAAGIVARYPERVYSRLLDIVGKPFAEAKKLLASEYLPFDIVEDERGGAGFKIDNGESVLSAEELLSMILAYAKTLGENHVKSNIKDAVIAVPPYLGQTERECIIVAAELGGLNVLALVNQHAGAALQYGINKDFSSEPRHVIFYDMGAASTFAALVYYSAYTIKEFGKNATINQFQESRQLTTCKIWVKEVSWDAATGGNKMELRLIDYFSDLFNKELGNGVDIRQFPKAVAKLKKQVKRTKEILSANTEAILSVESLHDDHDFRTVITRKKFEELCEDIWRDALVPIEQVLERSGLSVEQLHAVELIGGATRVPRLQTALLEFLGKADLDRHLDADEAVALGAALHAANISDGIKMNRKLGMIDVSLYSLAVKFYDNQEGAKVEQLVPRLKKIPIKVVRASEVGRDFQISLFYDADIIPPGIASSDITTLEINGVGDAYLKYSSYNLTSPMKTNLHFALSRSSVLSLDRAEMVVEFSEWIEIAMKNVTGNETKPAFEKLGIFFDSEGEVSNNDDKAIGDNPSMSERSTDCNNTDNKDNEAVNVIVERKLRKRTIRTPLKIKEVTKGVVRPLPKDACVMVKIRLDKINQQEEEKRRTAEAKNNLESYIYATKEKLDSMDNIEKVSTEEQRDSFKRDLNAAEEWLYDEEAAAVEYTKRLESLKALGEPIFYRLSELKARPAAVDFALKFIENLEETLKEWKTKKPWISDESKAELLKSANEFRKWLSEKQQEQQKTPGHEDLIFTSDDVFTKIGKLEEKLSKLRNTPKPKPEVKKPPKKANESQASEEMASKTAKSTEKAADLGDEPEIAKGSPEGGEESYDEL